MALDGNRLGDAIRTAIDNVSDSTDRTALFRAVGNAIIAEFQTSAVVTTTVAVTNVTGVTAGAATSGPGAGTGTGTIS